MVLCERDREAILEAIVVLLGPVAQRLEQGTHNPLVAGSNPAGPTDREGSNAVRLPRPLLSGIFFQRAKRATLQSRPKTAILPGPPVFAALRRDKRCAMGVGGKRYGGVYTKASHSAEPSYDGNSAGPTL